MTRSSSARLIYGLGARIEDDDPALLTRIRQLARKGLNRIEILAALHAANRLNSIATLCKIIRRNGIVVAPTPPHRAQVIATPELERMRSLAIAEAQDNLKREIADAKANPAPLSYKAGGVWQEW